MAQPEDDSRLEEWLRTMRPRKELIVRYALRGCFTEMQNNRFFWSRTIELVKQLNLSGDGLLGVLKLAKRLEADIKGVPADSLRRVIDATLIV
jgi:hypothetical protein